MDKKNSCNQHFIPQALINRWKINNQLPAFLTKTEEIKNIPSDGILSSKTIIKLNDNKKIENYLNSTKIEDTFNILAKEIIDGKYRLKRIEVDVLWKYCILLCTFEDCFWWGDEIKINNKQKEFIDSIVNSSHYSKYYIYISPSEPFVLTKSSFRLRYKNCRIFPISPYVCLGLGDYSYNGKGGIDKELNLHINEDAISEGRCGDVILFNNISIARLKTMCKKNNLEGNYILLNIDRDMSKEADSQGMNTWRLGDNLIIPGENAKYRFA